MSDSGEITILTAATNKSKSLRTTIPAGIVRQFSLIEGDKIQWKMEVEGNQLMIVARPIKNANGRVNNF